MNLGSLSGLTGVFSSIVGSNIASTGAAIDAENIIQGGEVTAEGYRLSAQGFRQSAESLKGASQFNFQVDNMNTIRRLAAANRQYQRAYGSQLLAAAASGGTIGTKSFLQVQNETRSMFETNLLNMKVDAENNRRAKQYDIDTRLVTLENQARASDWRAQAERVLSANKAAQVRYAARANSFGMIGGAVQKFAGGLFG